jgi:hypothetical protein
MKRLRFLHIQKTAGLTLNQILLRQYRGKKVFQVNGPGPVAIQQYMELSEQEKQKIFLILGHLPLTTGVEDFDHATIITLLRNPISRVRSLCQHVSEGKSKYLLKDFPPESFDLDRFLDSGDHQLYNHQTKILINPVSTVSNDLINSMSRAAARDLALDKLFNVVARFGIQEQFDETLILFSQFLNWSMPFYVSVNISDSRRRIEFKQRHLDRIAELNSIDMEVYNAAKKKFQEIITGSDYDTAGLKRFKALKPWGSRLLKMRAGIRALIQR